MKRLIAIFLALHIALPKAFEAKESFQELPRQTEELYETGCGCRDGAFTSLGIAMFGTGIVLAIVIAVIASSSHGHHQTQTK